MLVFQLNLNTAKFKVPETYMFTYSATSGRGTSVNFEDMCTHTLEITLCSREKIKNSVNVSALISWLTNYSLILA